MLNKIKNFYLWGFTKIINAFKAVVRFNKALISNVKKDFSNKKYIRATIKTVAYGVFLLIQFILFLLLLASYVMCKLTGVCLLLPF